MPTFPGMIRFAPSAVSSASTKSAIDKLVIRQIFRRAGFSIPFGPREGSAACTCTSMGLSLEVAAVVRRYDDFGRNRAVSKLPQPLHERPQAVLPPSDLPLC